MGIVAQTTQSITFHHIDLRKASKAPKALGSMVPPSKPLLERSKYPVVSKPKLSHKGNSCYWLKVRRMIPTKFHDQYDAYLLSVVRFPRPNGKLALIMFEDKSRDSFVTPRSTIMLDTVLMSSA